MIIFIAILIVAGWLVFSLCAGVIVYLVSMTTNHATIEPKKMMEAEKKSVLNFHTKDSAVMNPLNAAKEQWIKNRNRGFFDVLSVKSREGLSLVGYYRANEKNIHERPKTVIIVHGMMDSAAGMAYLFDEYFKHGWNVLAIDLRSHGESEGSKRTMGIREGEDLALWVTLILSRYHLSSLYLHGVSMGAVSVLSYAAHAKIIPAELKGIIADSCFASYRETLVRLLKFSVGNSFVAQSIASGASTACFFNTGVRFGRMETRRLVNKIKIPMLFFHGQNDVLIPLVTMRTIFGDLVKLKNEVTIIPSAPHIGTYFYSPELYMEKIMKFSGSEK